MDNGQKSAADKKTRRRATGTQTIAIGFIIIIMAGALLLSLPIASRSGQEVSFIDALFTATTATCVTGLVVTDTYTQWNIFGQIVILLLIQVGGIGFMAVGTLFSMVINRRIGFRERMILSEAISLDSMSGVVRLTKSIIICVAVFEALGAVMLSFSFVPRFGPVNGIYKAVFHSVSAFCNAGIDLMGEVGQYSSLTSFVFDPLVNFTVMALIIVGGLGFTVWEDLYRFKKNRRLRLHTKLVLIISGLLIAGGFALFFIFEYSNPQTIGTFSLWNKIQASLFQSVTARTAGFNTIDLASMKDQSILVMMVLMMVGGSPGSTAGGIKTTTVGILIISAFVVARGSSKVHIFGKRVSNNQIMRALAIIILSIIIVCTGVLVLLAADNLTMKDAIFETVSAFGTVGLTLGVTTKLGTVSKLTVITLMYLGRVGVMTALMAIAKRQHSYDERITYPVETIIF